MLRGGQHLLGRTPLDDQPGLHYRNLVGHLCHHPEVVGDEHERHPELLAQAPQQREDLRLHRHVERGGGLVGDQQLRLVGERHSDHHALAHPPGELVRVGIHPS